MRFKEGDAEFAPPVMVRCLSECKKGIGSGFLEETLDLLELSKSNDNLALLGRSWLEFIGARAICGRRAPREILVTGSPGGLNSSGLMNKSSSLTD